jgi:hypothetical protein
MKSMSKLRINVGTPIELRKGVCIFFEEGAFGGIDVGKRVKFLFFLFKDFVSLK